MKTIKPFWNSLVFKLLLGVILIIVPLIVVQIINSFYAVRILTSQVTQTNKNMLNIYMNQIDESLEGVTKYIYQLSTESDLLYLQPNVASDYNEYTEAKLRLFQAISTQSNFYTTIDSTFIYASHYNEIIHTQKYGNSYLDRFTTVSEIINLLEEGYPQQSNGRWIIHQGSEKHYLLHVIQNGDVYVGAWVNMESLISPFKYIDFGETGMAVLTTADNEPITNKSFFEKEGINITSGPSIYTLDGKTDRFLVMQEKSNKAAFNLIAIIPEKQILAKLPYLRRISQVIGIGALVFLLAFFFYMRKVFIQPINRIVYAMKKLRNGNFDIRLPEYSNSTEFEIMNDSFNKMTTEIRDLKINVYEEKLNLQRAELKHLQLQINPHFFLNSLNIIYNLATVKDFTLIHEMSKSLANYFRFMFKSNSYFVNLDDELSHTKNYLKIQQLRFPDTFSYFVVSPQELSLCRVPPLIIQTLVENSIKHAFNMDQPIEISVSVWKEDNEDFIKLKVQDTGEGFPEEVLVNLEKNELLPNDNGERIGIWNVKRRLSLLYGEKALITFTNEIGKGATVNIRIPIEVAS
jgi:two-component system, sensor histidine kinase YesM